MPVADRQAAPGAGHLPAHRSGRACDACGLDHQLGHGASSLSAHLAEVYGTSVSRQQITGITDAVVEKMAQWQSRPLDAVYPVVFIDAINVKIRDGQVANRPIYVALAVTCDGTRDVLGLWAGEHGDGEGAKYWLRVLSEIKNRGVNDVCMIVCDGLKHLPAAVASVWPQTIVQACIVHLLRNSFKYASKKDWAAIAKALKPVYTATSETDALDRFVEFCEAWGRRYPAIVRLWENAWAEFVPFLAFDKEIRTVICTTNAIWVFESSRRHAGLARDRGAGLEALQDPAAPVRDVQVLHRPRAGGEGPRHCRALPRVRLGESWAGELGGDGGVVAAAGVGCRRCAAGAVGLTGVVLVVAVDDPGTGRDRAPEPPVGRTGSPTDTRPAPLAGRGDSRLGMALTRPAHRAWNVRIVRPRVRSAAAMRRRPWPGTSQVRPPVRRP